MDHQRQRSQASRQPSSDPVRAPSAESAQNGGNAFALERLGLGRASTQMADARTPRRKDMDREGTLTDPRDRSKAVPVDQAIREAQAAGGPFGAYLMNRYGFGPQLPEGGRGDTLRFFVPGLNTPEPEASRRTRYLADATGQPMMHLHNGTNKDSGLPHADQIDNVAALATRQGLKSTPLMDRLERLLTAALSGADPQDVHAILHSDATIGGTRMIGEFRRKEIARRLKASGRRDGSAQQAAAREVDSLLRRHLFVELHGNAAADLPQGPRYLVWTDFDDPVSHNEIPLIGKLGVSGANPDRDNGDAVYIDYDGPYKNWDSHNLTAGGIHVVNATLEANGVKTSQELWERAAAGLPIAVPKGVQGDPKEMWNPHNK